ncbi:MAG: hypothetical protein JXA42_08605, partial [Anaerolineales bacterium]|nr:hypothetical protein [Anaerolineales bacterium]
EGDHLIATFQIDNTSDDSMHLVHAGVRGRRNGTEYWDIGFWEVTIQPHDTFSLEADNERPLEPGDYSFRVSYSTDGDNWTEIGNEINFTVAESEPVIALTYAGPPTLPNNSFMLDEVDHRITVGDHVHLRLPFKNTGDSTINDAAIRVTGSPDTGGYIGVSIHNGSSWQNSNQQIELSPSALAPGQTGFADFWIYVSNDALINRNLLTGNSWLEINYGETEWKIPIILSGITFDIEGYDDLKEGDCLHHPNNFEIKKYAQFAAGANRSDIMPTNIDDPDTARQAILNLVHRVNLVFHYKEIWTSRMPDTVLLATQYNDIGVCRDYADLTIGLLRSLGLPARFTDAIFIESHQSIDQGMEITLNGHAWVETYLDDDGWRQVDSTWNRAFMENIYESSGITVVRAWADKYPLSSASIWAGPIYQCIEPCYTEEESCIDCFLASMYQDAGQEDLSCVEDVTGRYHQSRYTTEDWLSRDSRSSNEQLLVTIQSPTFVTRTLPLTLDTRIVNSTTLPMNAITATVAISEYIDSQSPLFDVSPSYQILHDVDPGQAITLTWTVTPLITGSGIPLRVGAFSGDQFDFDEQPLVVNEPGTLPDLYLGVSCGPGDVSPGQVITLSAFVQNEMLQTITDTGTLITATVYATPTLGFSTTVNLAFCDTCQKYQAALTLPDSAPIGTYQVDYVAQRSGYEPDSATRFFFVTPLLTSTVTVSRETIDAHETVTLTAQILDRTEIITGANVLGEISTPAGAIVLPLTNNNSPTYTVAFQPFGLLANLDGDHLSGEWPIKVTADYMGKTAVVEKSILVHSAPNTITLSGPDNGLVGTGYIFTTTVGSWATTPITYQWQTEESIIHSSGLTDTAVITWTTPGTQTVVVTATNAYGWISAAHEITLNTPVQVNYIYLPLVLRN